MAKVERASISFSADLVGSMDAVAAEEFAGNRSGYIDSLVRADLERRGRLDLTPAEKALATAKAALERVGPEALIAALDDLLAESATATTKDPDASAA